MQHKQGSIKQIIVDKSEHVICMQNSKLPVARLSYAVKAARLLGQRKPQLFPTPSFLACPHCPLCGCLYLMAGDLLEHVGHVLLFQLQ